MAKNPTPKKLRRIAYALGEYLGSHHPETGAQLRGPVWRGPLPRRATPVNYAAIPKEIREHNRPLEERQLGFGVVPGSPLAQMLGQLPRRDRRLLLATVQAPATRRRARNERRLSVRLRALGVVS